MHSWHDTSESQAIGRTRVGHALATRTRCVAAGTSGRQGDPADFVRQGDPADFVLCTERTDAMFIRLLMDTPGGAA